MLVLLKWFLLEQLFNNNMVGILEFHINVQFNVSFFLMVYYYTVIEVCARCWTIYCMMRSKIDGLDSIL